VNIPLKVSTSKEVNSSVAPLLSTLLILATNCLKARTDRPRRITLTLTYTSTLLVSLMTYVYYCVIAALYVPNWTMPVLRVVLNIPTYLHVLKLGFTMTLLINLQASQVIRCLGVIA
jgi:hypothetical protein